jgi:murein L,D-transpeptidase YcbB/YkuD
VALKDMDVGVKILGGLTAFALLLALMSNGEPDNDAWGADEATEASQSSQGDTDTALVADDPWSEPASEDVEALRGCDGTAPFAADGGTIRLPVHGPVTPFAAADCRLDPWHGGGEAVRLLQVALATCNDQPVAVDGDYGAETRRAVSALQARLGIGVDGIYGPQTRGAMAWPMDSGEGEAGAVSCGTAPDGH